MSKQLQSKKLQLKKVRKLRTFKASDVVTRTGGLKETFTLKYPQYAKPGKRLILKVCAGRDATPAYSYTYVVGDVMKKGQEEDNQVRYLAAKAGCLAHRRAEAAKTLAKRAGPAAAALDSLAAARAVAANKAAQRREQQEDDEIDPSEDDETDFSSEDEIDFSEDDEIDSSQEQQQDSAWTGDVQNYLEARVQLVRAAFLKPPHELEAVLVNSVVTTEELSTLLLGLDDSCLTWALCALTDARIFSVFNLSVAMGNNAFCSRLIINMPQVRRVAYVRDCVKENVAELTPILCAVQKRSVAEWKELFNSLADNVRAAIDAHTTAVAEAAAAPTA
jgi:hypothetical protein